MITRILLADAHQALRQKHRALLEEEPDFEVVAEAGGGEAAVRLAGELKPHVVVLDLAIAGLQGLDPVHQVLAAAPLAKVIGLSMYGDRSFVVEVLKAGALGYVLKDYAFSELAAAIRAVQDNKTYISRGLFEVVIQDYIELLRNSESRFRTIFEGSSMGIALVDKEGRIVECNPALQELLGYSEDELCNKDFSKLAPPEDAGKSKEDYQEMLAGQGQSLHQEKQYKRKDGRLVWGRLFVYPSRGGGNDGRFSIRMLEDINYQKQAASQIRDYQEKLHSVALELSLTEERERRRLATDLHDHVAQILALAQVKLEALQDSGAAALHAPLDEVRQLIGQTIRYTRSMTSELSPPILYDLGFIAAVEWLAELIQEQYGIHLKVAADQTPMPLDDELRVLLFQLVRELLVNVVQRAKPNNVALLISRNGSDMGVKIESDGAEFDLSPESLLPSPSGLGLFSFRERLKYLGGRLEVESEPNHGTQVNLVVPLKY